MSEKAASDILANNRNMKSLVVMSGGQDSATCLAWAMQRGPVLLALSFSYGQKHAKELQAAAAICAKLGVAHKIMDLSPIIQSYQSSALVNHGDTTKPHAYIEDVPASFVPVRNALFLTAAFGVAMEIGAHAIVTGVCQTDYCIPGDAMVYTSTGVKPLSALRVGDLVMSFDPETGLRDDKPIVMHSESPHQPTLLRIELKGGSVIEVTPNHHLMRGTYQKDNNGVACSFKLQVCDANKIAVGDNLIIPNLQHDLPSPGHHDHDIVDLCDHLPHDYLCGKATVTSTQIYNSHQLKVNRFVEKLDLVRLVGWYVTEGTASRDINSPERIAIYQSPTHNADNHAKISALLGRFGVDREFTTEEFCVAGAVGAFCRTLGTNSFDMRLPDWVFDLSDKLRSELLQVLLDGDGCVHNGAGFNFYTVNKFLSSQFNRLAVSLGWRVTTRRRPGTLAENVSYESCLSHQQFSKQRPRRTLGQSSFTSVTSITEVPNNRVLYDLTVADHHTLVIDQQGPVIVSQSGYPDCRARFVNSLEHALQVGYNSKIAIKAPLMYHNKAQTFQLAEQLGVLDIIINDTLTCYNGDADTRNPWGRGCGECPACKLRAKGYEDYLLLSAIPLNKEPAELTGHENASPVQQGATFGFGTAPGEEDGW